MTNEGIIQKVLLNWYHAIQSNDTTTSYPKLVFPSDMVLLEQELIEEIKRDCSPDTSYYESMITRRRLIGDIE